MTTDFERLVHPHPSPLPEGEGGRAFLEVRGVAKSFGKTTALNGVTFDVGADELLVVLGPTGAGKTTLLRTIAGLETPDAGSISMAAKT